jgi:hypothetical protein
MGLDCCESQLAMREAGGNGGLDKSARSRSRTDPAQLKSLQRDIAPAGKSQKRDRESDKTQWANTSAIRHQSEIAVRAKCPSVSRKAV